MFYIRIKNTLFITLLLIIFDASFPSIVSSSGKFNDSSLYLTGEDYITGEDGVPRMSINIWGHVNSPGAYLVYDGIDILTCLSMAGGPLRGAKLSKVTIISEDGTSSVVNLTSILDGRDNFSVKLKPYDTIYIDQTLGNYLLQRSAFVNTILQLTNLIVTISNR
tara:strand:+ start:666 stop:1157 length:492 start_codon:yes stop_codon:yes gene_type:complete